LQSPHGCHVARIQKLSSRRLQDFRYRARGISGEGSNRGGKREATAGQLAKRQLRVSYSKITEKENGHVLRSPRLTRRCRTNEAPGNGICSFEVAVKEEDCRKLRLPSLIHGNDRPIALPPTSRLILFMQAIASPARLNKSQL
jgi:hypothetical protein